MREKDRNRKDFPGRRWLIVGLRTVHLVGVILLGIALVTGQSSSWATGGVLLSGLAMLAIDTWAKPSHLRELSGATLLVKLGLLGLGLMMPALLPGIFWLLVVISSVVSHAPGDFRHRRLGSIRRSVN